MSGDRNHEQRTALAQSPKKESKYVVKEQWAVCGTKGRGVCGQRRCKTVICWSIKSRIIMSLWRLTEEFRQYEKGNKKVARVF